MKLFRAKKKVTKTTEKEIELLLHRIEESVEKLDKVWDADRAERILLKKVSKALYERCASLLNLVEGYEEQRHD